jgi:DnaJ-class molecular chaperone
MDIRTHYDALKLKNNCTQQDIRNSFNKLSKKYHPQNHCNIRYNLKFMVVCNAYQVLSDPIIREKYDEYLLTHNNNSFFEIEYLEAKVVYNNFMARQVIVENELNKADDILHHLYFDKLDKIIIDKKEIQIDNVKYTKITEMNRNGEEFIKIEKECT